MKPRCQNPEHDRPVKGDLIPRPRTPSVGSDLDLAAERVTFAVPVTASRSPRTLSPDALEPLLRREGAAAPCYPTPSRPASRRTSKTTGRCFSPTSATDIQHEHPWNARIPGARLAPRRPQGTSARGTGPYAFSPCGARPPRGDRTPAEARLTARLSASAHSLTYSTSPHPFRSGCGASGTAERPHVIRAFSTRLTLASDL